MAVNIIDLNNKKEDNGSSNQGVLRADEFNRLVNAVIDNQTALQSVVKGIKLSGKEYFPTETNKGVVDITPGLSGDKYSISINLPENYKLPNIIKKGDPCTVLFTISHNKTDGSVFSSPCKASINLGGTTIDVIENIYDSTLSSNGSSMKTLVEYDLTKTNKLSTSTDGNLIEIKVENEYGAFDVLTFSVLVVDGSVTLSLNNGLSGYNVYDKDTELKLTAKTTHNGKLTLNINGNVVNKNITTSQDLILNIKEEYKSFITNGLNKVVGSVELRDEKYLLKPDNELTEGIDESEYFNIYSNEITFIYSDSTTIPSVMISVNNNQTTFDEYSTLIFDYTIYKPENVSSNTVWIELWAIDNKGEKVDRIGDSKFQEVYFTGKVNRTSGSIILFDENGHMNGDYELVVKYEYTQLDETLYATDSYKINVKKSDVDLSANNNYHVYLSSYNKSNVDNKKDVWENGKDSIDSSLRGTNLLTINTPFEFNESGTGWNNVNNDGIIALSLKRGKYITINYEPFAKKFIEHDVQNGVNGKTISFEFTTKNCINQNCSIISCLSEVNGKNVGFEIKVNEVNVYSASTSANAKFKEEEKVRVDIVIEGKYKHYKTNSLVGDGSKNESKPEEIDQALIIIYINGVYQRLVNFDLKSDNFNQNVNKANYITIGSEGCDIDLYTIRIYEDALDFRSLLNNYSYDTPNPEDRIKLKVENDIFVDNETDENGRPLIDIGKLKKARPALPIWTSMLDNDKGELPNNKKTWKALVEMKYENPLFNKAEDVLKGGVSWEADMGVLRNQGTSSMNYPMPWRNWDFKLDDKVNGGAGKEKKFYIPSKIASPNVKEKTWFQYRNMPGGIKKITLKKDYASSEMCNNAICSSIYTDMALGLSTLYSDIVYDLMKPRQYVDSNNKPVIEHTGFRFTFLPVNCVMFNKHNNESAYMESLGMMNLIPNKNEVSYLGMDFEVEKTEIVDGVEKKVKIKHAWNNGGKGPTIETDCDVEGVDRTQSWEIAENHVLWNKKLETFYVTEDIKNYTTVDGKKYGSKSGLRYCTTQAEINEITEAETRYIAPEDITKVTSDKAYFEVTYKTEDGVTKRKDKNLGNVFNGIEGNYEARYPKDSTGNDILLWGGTKEKPEEADFGFSTGGKLDDDKFTCIYNEHKDILEFHNWLYDVNLGYATDRKLTQEEKDVEWNITKDGAYIYTTDSVSYRKARFEAEAPSRMIIDQWILYYIWRETFWMFDSGAKNLQIYSFGPAKDSEGKPYPYMQWGVMVRDADTALGIDNVGKELFPAHLEDTDYYTLKDNKAIFYYDGAAKCYSTEQLAKVHSDLLNRPESIYYEEVAENTGNYILNDEGIYELVAENTGNYIKKNKHEAVAKMVLNGQFGSAWINLREAYGARGGRIAKMYAALRSNSDKTNFSYNKAYKLFDEHQDKWCKALYNYGMRQYHGGTLFNDNIKAGNGDKKLSRRAWLEKSFYYRDTKYDALGNGFSFRGEEVIPANLPENERGIVNIKTYAPQYLATGSNDQTMEKAPNKKRLTNIDEGINFTTLEMGIERGGFDWSEKEQEGQGEQGSVATDKNIYLFGAEQITDFGDLSKAIKFQNIKFATSMDKLLTFRLGNKDKKWIDGNGNPITNEILASLDCGSLKKLTELDVTNHKALSSLNVKDCKQLEKLYAEGTNALKFIEFPQTSTLKEIILGNNIETLKLINLTGVTLFTCNNYSSISNLEIQGCNDYINSLSYRIFKDAFNTLKSNYLQTGVKNCIIYDINWDTTTGVTASDLVDLASINADIKGTVTLQKLSFEEKQQLQAIYNKVGHNIDTGNPKEGLVIKVLNFEKLEGVKITPDITYAGIVGSTYSLSFTPDNAGANNVYDYKWELQGNETYCSYIEILSNGSYLEFKRVGVPVNEPKQGDPIPEIKAIVNIYCYANAEKTAVETITKEAIIRMYDRKVRVGDIVYHDGTTSSVSEMNRSKIPIGVCFYVEDSIKVGDSNRKPIRLMCSLKNVKKNLNGAGKPSGAGDISFMAWGPYGSLINLELNSSNINLRNVEYLKDYGFTHESDSSKLLFEHAKTGNSWTAFDVNTDTYGETGTYAFGELGARKLKKSDIPFDLNNVTNNIFNENDIIPFGKYNTIMTIYERNKVLNDTLFINESRIHIPSNTSRTEIADLDLVLSNLDNTYTNEESVLYEIPYAFTLAYPLISRAYAYRPYYVDPISDNEEENKKRIYTLELNSEFAEHNWWVPSIGEYFRLYYYVHAYVNHKNNISNNRHDDDDIFSAIEAQSISDKNDPLLKDTQYKLEWEMFDYNIYCMSSTENKTGLAYGLYLNVGNNISDIQVSSLDKAQPVVSSLRPICQF